MSDISVTALYVYPVKSCRGIALDSARITATGFEYDRHWMVTDTQGRFLTQRRFPLMALIECELAENGGLRLSAPAMAPLTVTNSTDALRPARVWGFEGLAHDCGDEASRWLSAYLGPACRLLVAADRWDRPVDPAYDDLDTRVAFADGFPFLLISQASLDELNRRLPASNSPMSMSRFRPNIVVDGCPAHGEDRWTKIKLGSLTMQIVKPCARCTIPQVDPLTGERGKEPSVTLGQYRQGEDGDIYFGQNLIHESRSGELRVGESVQILA